MASIVNDVSDIQAISDTRWKKALHSSSEEEWTLALLAPELPALADGTEDAPAPLPLPAPVALAVAPRAMDLPAHMRPMIFEFSCEGERVKICLDGCSHSSGIRRAYAKCPNKKHLNCFRYCQLAAFAEAWQAVAFILAYMRAGMNVHHKWQHQAVAVSNGDHLKDEMPVALLCMPSS